MNIHSLPTQSAVSYPRRFLRLPQVEELTGFKRSHIYNLMKAGSFPASVKLGLRAVAWDSQAIEQWQNERLVKSNQTSN
ncbi:AlpA family transcriptional regulator [Pseudomonas sp. NBRC 100443]|uniref:helix-turn-helix transcriptional regulator n=1 Tax=Pseudomonas sp. NBRC 100443 TaxID=1113665 RepID=UPI0024A57800|nr:AlpA family transcriptional regulator [Pseudomonas sp. NBRC 100443]GLU40077.1 AlpA family transcriptional regulator [Pseudomonas sp. NBRC 100443]